MNGKDIRWEKQRPGTTVLTVVKTQNSKFRHQNRAGKSEGGESPVGCQGTEVKQKGARSCLKHHKETKRDGMPH